MKEQVRVLVHDVGKYVSRTARNLPEGDIPDALVGMLCRDLYALSGGGRASAHFEELAEGLSDPVVERCREHFRTIDRLEPAVRVREDEAVRRAAACAIDVHRALVEWLEHLT